MNLKNIKPYWFFVAGIVILWISVLSFSAKEGFMGSPSGPIFTMFGSTSCPHCIHAKPDFAKLGPTVTIGDKAVTCRYVEAPKADPKLLGRHKVEGYPTYTLEIDGKIWPYNGDRSSADMRAFLESKLVA